MIENLHQAMYFRLVVEQSVGEVKKRRVALSTAEAEYVALASAAQEAIWMRQLTTDLKSAPDKLTIILEDDQSAISMSKYPQFHGRTKDIELKFHFIREQVKGSAVELKYCPTEEMVADANKRTPTSQIC